MAAMNDEARRLTALVEPLRVEPGRKVHLARDFDPRYKDGLLSKADAEGVLQASVELLADYQASAGRPGRLGPARRSCRRSTPAARTARSAM